MGIRTSKAWEAVRTSYWFVPSLMALATVGVAFVTLRIDRAWPHAVDGWPGVYRGSADGARVLLSTLTGAMITVTGVVFSITIVTLTLATQHFGPRLLRRFKTDVATQVVLGMFVANFLYCLLVLRAVRDDQVLSPMVPSLSVTLAMLASLASFGVLIYFIHHVSGLIQVDNVIASVERDLDSALDALFPGESGERAAADGGETLPEGFDAECAAVFCRRPGYIQAIHTNELLALARRHDLVLRLLYRPGHFVPADSEIARAWPASRADDRVTDAVRDAHVIGRVRTPAQDVEFAIRQLVEIALRALSPGINDTFTAIACVDYLGAALCRFAEKPPVRGRRHDDDGRLRVVAPTESFAGAMDAAFDQIRQSAATNVAVSARLLEAFLSIARHLSRPDQADDVRRHTRMVRDAILSHAEQPHDRAQIERRHGQVEEELAARERETAP